MLRAAIDALGEGGLSEIEISPLYETVALPVSDQPNFLNCALKAFTSFSAAELLSLFKRVEKTLGREAATRWAPRVIDIDLIAYGDSVLPNREAWDDLAGSGDPSAFFEEVTVPHPRLHKRAFVLLPLLDIAAEWTHPCLGRSVSEMARHPDINSQALHVVKISDTL